MTTVYSAAFSPDGKRVVTASGTTPRASGTPHRRRRSSTLEGHDGHVLSAAFSPDGKRVVTASV